VRSNDIVTAKEELRELVAHLTEDEAREWIKRAREAKTGLREGTLSRLPPEEREAALRAMFAQWEAEGGYMTDEEWDEFARDFDAQRPHRPLFAEYLSDAPPSR
jgi:acyl-CoA reductase-like NAD-dependent aldehyde dehydrogenase